MILKSSYIYIKGVRFHAYIGVGDLEREVGNDYIIDLRLQYPIEKAMQSDDVEDTLSYAEVFELLKTIMKRPAKLLEYVAGNIVNELTEAFPKIEGIDLKLTKLNPPMGADCDGAGVELHLINDKTQ